MADKYSPVQQHTPRKRGRPPIIKHYDNPLESPMAHSSIQVQKQGTQSFTKPLMRVGQITPKVKKRRHSNVGAVMSNSSMVNLDGSAGSSPSVFQNISGSNLKRGKYRGVILSSPISKRNLSNSNNSTPLLTPLSNDSMFMSPTKSNSKSTPLNLSAASFFDHHVTDIDNHSEDAGNHHLFGNFSLSLNINKDGRASIGGFGPNNIFSHNDEGQSNIEKGHVLGLLKQMKNSAGSTNSKRVKLSPKNDEHRVVHIEDEHQHSLAPRTPPRHSANLQVMTGSTPSTNLDQVILNASSDTSPSRNNDPSVLSSSKLTLSPITNLLASPKLFSMSPARRQGVSKFSNAMKNGHKQNPVQQKQYVFKLSSGDPILMTDDMGDHIQENVQNHLVSSPGKGSYFNTPPSFVNFGSPNGLLFSPYYNIRTTNGLLHDINNDNVDGHLTRVENKSSNSAHFNISPPSVNITSSKGETTEFNKNKSNIRGMVEPRTPKSSKQGNIRTNLAAFQFSPLTESLLQGNLNSKGSLPMLSPDSHNDMGNTKHSRRASYVNSIRKVNNDDARAALKKLIDDGY